MPVDYHHQHVLCMLIILRTISSVFQIPTVQIRLFFRNFSLTHAEISSSNIYCYLDSLVIPSSVNSLFYKIQGFFKTVNREQLIKNMVLAECYLNDPTQQSSQQL